jgi:hypothetical protein
MTGTNTAIPGRRRARQALVFAAICALLVGVAAVSSAGASKAKVLGKTKHTPDPACPKDPCEAIGSVTGFQIVANGEKQPFKVHRDGKLVAWAIDLSRPDKSQRNYFGKFFKDDKFGTEPTARIAVIKRVEHRNYKLKSRGPVARLGSDLGGRVLFTLGKPLSIKQGDTVALTVPTWASAFANELSRKNNAWRASRDKGECRNRHDIRNGRSQQKVGSIREYGCDYRTARLLYWAYYVPD